MRKHINKILIVAFTAFITVSCSDAYDIIQDGELSDQAVFRSTSDLEKYLSGSVYTSLDLTNQVKFTSVFTDEVSLGPSNTGQDQGLHRYILNANDGYASAIWIGSYTTINRVNRLLKAAATITPSASEQVAYNNTLAEAKALRAFAYITLQSYFTTNMKDNNALGVILSTEVPEINAQLPRSTNGAIWALIEDDLNFAYNNINASYQAQTSVNHTSPLFASKNLVNGLRARMYTYRGDYTKAKQYALDVLANSGLTLTLATPNAPGAVGSATWNNVFYSETANPSPYRKIWADAAPGETIFSLGRLVGGTGGNIASAFTTNTTQLSGSPLFTFGINLFNAINSSAADIRRYAFIDPTSTPANNVYVIDKYPGKGNEPLKNNHKVMRLSEIYLILAECEAQSNLTAAATYIKNVRDARNYLGTSTTAPVYASKQDALKDILKERRVELCFEGHRYIDLRRLGAEAGVSIDRNVLDDIITSPLTLSISDHRFTLPIPSSEINGNPTIQQNAGY